MAALKLKENLYYVGASNPALRVFDIIMMADYGTTYNSYLITGPKNVLVEAAHERFYDELIENIDSIVPVEKLDYLIMNHNEPDHSGCIRQLLDRNPELTIVSSAGGKKFLENILNRPFNSLVVKQGESLDIGQGALEFIMAPMLHWPDTMFTYFPAGKTIFTCDFLGAHFCEPWVLDTHVHYPEKYDEAFAYYYAAIFGPFKPYVIQGLDKIAPLDFDMVCCSHGPVLTESIQKRMDEYRAWSTPAPREGKPYVPILYASSYGYTGHLAKAAYEAIKDDVNAELIDVVFTAPGVAAAKANEADALLVGSCTLNRDAVKPIWDLVTSLDAVNTPSKPAGAFGSYGWTGEAVGMLKERFLGLKYKFVGDGYRCIFRPSDDDLAAMGAYAKEVVAGLK